MNSQNFFRESQMNFKRIIFLSTLVLCLAPVQLLQPARATVTPRPNAVYLFVEIETTSSENPVERRWYFSNVIIQPEDVATYSLIKQKFMPYFSRNVMDPAEKRGILIDYGEQDVRLNGESSEANYVARAQAEEQRNKGIEHRKKQGGSIYSFEIDFNSPKGEEASKPKLIYRDKEQRNYERLQ
jgi:hypothetical protein